MTNLRFKSLIGFARLPIVVSVLRLRAPSVVRHFGGWKIIEDSPRSLEQVVSCSSGRATGAPGRVTTVGLTPTLVRRCTKVHTQGATNSTGWHATLTAKAELSDDAHGKPTAVRNSFGKECHSIQVCFHAQVRQHFMMGASSHRVGTKSLERSAVAPSSLCTGYTASLWC